MLSCQSVKNQRQVEKWLISTNQQQKTTEKQHIPSVVLCQDYVVHKTDHEFESQEKQKMLP